MGRKFTILGESNSGKTCYLLAIYAAMAGGFEGYSIRAQKPEVNAELLDRYKALANRQLDHKNRFPEASFEVENYSFNLGYANKTILPFDWIDYPGGNLVLSDGVDREQYEKVAKNIQESSVLFVCVDGELLSDKDDDIEDKIDNLTPLSMSINPYFNDYLESGKKMPPVGFIVTKYDLCCDTTTSEDLKEIFFKAFSPFFADKGNTVGIIPVSLGKNIADDNYHGKLRPMNVHLPIFMGIYFALCDQIKTNKNYQNLIDANLRDSANRRDNNSRRQSELLKLKDKIATLKEERKNEQDEWWIFRDEDLIKSKTRDIDITQATIDRLNSEIETEERRIRANELEIANTQKLIQNVITNDEKFIEYLNHIMWFLDGAWQNSFRG